MVRAAALILACVSVAATAAPATFDSKVAKAKASLLEAADQAFVETWRDEKAQAAMARAGIASTLVRESVQWSVMGFSLGVCRKHAKAGLMADWYGRFDRLGFGAGEIADMVRGKAREMGAKALADGETTDLLDELTAKEREGYCAVELEAVRQLLGE